MTAGSFDVDAIRRHLAALGRAVENLRRHRGKSVETLARELDEVWAVERGLQLCAQNALDVATHLAATAGRDAADYTSSIDRLSELGILPADFAARFRGVAGLRNVLVHAYLDVDLARVHAILNEHLEDFTEFARHVERHLGD